MELTGPKWRNSFQDEAWVPADRKIRTTSKRPGVNRSPG
jgi:hypothetical protein